MATEKRLIYLEDAIAKIVDTPSDVATMAFEGYYGFIRNPANILVDIQHEILDLLEAVSTVDAVEVVRCKDCKFYKDSPMGGKGCHTHFNGRTEFIPKNDNDFCSYGGKKIDEQKDC